MLLSREREKALCIRELRNVPQGGVETIAMRVQLDGCLEKKQVQKHIGLAASASD
jgi:hypothetical protein